MPAKTLNSSVGDLLKIDEEEAPSAKEVLKRQKKLKDDLTSRVLAEETLPQASKFYADLDKRPGCVSYKTIVDELIRDNPELEDYVETRKEEFREKVNFRLVYGRKKERTADENQEKK